MAALSKERRAEAVADLRLGDVASIPTAAPRFSGPQVTVLDLALIATQVAPSTDKLVVLGGPGYISLAIVE